ncbi:MAG: diguanylate cyclase [Campylobacterota bacterium]|nr:diguanylate cyclase [Campylobacterota bacterium]
MSRAILCVDDEQIVLSALKSQLNTFFGDEIDIELAQSGEDGLEIIEELLEDDITIELIISDFLMPSMKGDEFLIKAHKLVPHTKKMLLTGQANLDGVAKIVNSGALYRYISKPWEKTDLIVTAKEALKSFETENELKYYTKHLEELVEKKTIENRTYLEIVDKYLIASKTDIDGTITEVSKALCDMTGYSKNELIGQNHNILRHKDMPDSLYSEIWETIINGDVWEGEIKNSKKDGTFYWVNARISPVLGDDGSIVSYASIRTDITDKKLCEMLSITDFLTKLYNRRYLNEIFSKEISRASRENKKLGFVILDVDFFKQYNDTYGHKMGDNVLVAISKTLKESLSRASDYAFRLGGEEFGILVYDTDLDGFTQLIESIRCSIEALHVEHTSSTASSYVTASFGGVVFHPTKISSEDVAYKTADNLLYKAKESGRNISIVKKV